MVAPRARALLPAVLAFGLSALSGCAVVSLGTAVVGTAVSIGGAAVSVGGAVVGGTAKVAGKAVGATVDALTPSSPPAPANAPAK